jgi:hypothetical protein
MNNDLSSGNLTHMLSLTKSCRIKKAVLRVRGIKYKGAIKSPEISITPLNESNNFTGFVTNFVVDFHGFRNVISIGSEEIEKDGHIIEVRPWEGTNFAKNPLDSPFLIKTEKILITINSPVNANFFENHFYVTVISYPLNLTLS